MDLAARIRSAIQARGVKQSWLADEAGIPAETLSRILTGTTENPGVYTVAKIARALGESVGSVLGESGFDLSGADLEEIRTFVRWADTKLLKAAPPKLDARESPNASRLTIIDLEPVATPGHVQARRARVAQFDPRRIAKRGRAAAGPDREIVADDAADLPEREIPTHYYELGARIAFKAEGDSMIGAGITDRDLLFVRPEKDARVANGKIVVCRVRGSEYVKKLDVSNGAIRLVSANERYGPMIVDEDADGFELIGVVVGRSGYPIE